MVVNILKRMTTHGRASELDGPGNWTACGSGEWTVVGEAHRQHLALAARGTWYLLGGVGEMAVLLQSCRGQAVRAACSNAGRSLRRRREASRCAAGGSDPWTASERLLPACQACQACRPHPSIITRARGRRHRPDAIGSDETRGCPPDVRRAATAVLQATSRRRQHSLASPPWPGRQPSARRRSPLQ